MVVFKDGLISVLLFNDYLFFCFVFALSPRTAQTQQSSSADLMIRNVLLKHAGKYGCRAQTSGDTVFVEAELLVRGEPVI